MYNVQRFLGEAVFETSQEARQKAGNSRPPELIHIYRKVDVPSSECIFFVHIDFSSFSSLKCVCLPSSLPQTTVQRRCGRQHDDMQCTTMRRRCLRMVGIGE